MNDRELFDALINAASIKELEAAIEAFQNSNGGVTEVPVGRRANNRGAIEVAADAGRSFIERVTNAGDGVLELEHIRHKGLPECRSPREAAEAWLGVPSTKGLAGLTNHDRQTLSKRVVVRLDKGEGTWQSRLISVYDDGVGILPNQMERTILSLNESNKISKHYLAGTYGQGGSSTYAFCRYAFIASRHDGSDEIAFTVVRYHDLPAEQFKTGHYVYLVRDDQTLSVKATVSDFARGTIVRHFGFDLSGYTKSIGPKSIYGVLQRVLFDPVVPLRFENNVHGWNRVIKGVRNALNGAVDTGDDGTGPELDHAVPMFTVSLGEYGQIGIEYWLLKRKVDSDGKPIPNQSDAFVDSRRPIILSHNGQNQGERSAALIRKDADLPFLSSRLIAHISCDRLTSNAKRLLFSSTREQSREGYLLDRIEKELVDAIKADDELRRLNIEARDASLNQKDEAAQQQMRKEVAKLLKIHGKATEQGGGTMKGDGDGTPRPTPKPRPKPVPITPSDPPTYIKLLWQDDSNIPFYGSQRRWLRVETDADSSYHTPDKPESSHVNIVVGSDLKVFGTSPLTGGRMRVGVECGTNVAIGSKGDIRIELYRPGHSTLGDGRQYEITKQPEPPPPNATKDFPDFDVIPVTGPDDPNWQYVSPDPVDRDVAKHASGMVMSGGKLLIYYSEAFPRYAAEMKRLETQSPAFGKAFASRYKMWMAVHSLLMHQDIEIRKEEIEEEAETELEREERCRIATMAAMMAAQDIKTAAETEPAALSEA